MKPLTRSFFHWLLSAAILFSFFCFEAHAQTSDDDAIPPKLRPIVTPDSKKNWHRFIEGISVDPRSPEDFFAKHQDAFELPNGYGMKLTKQTEEKDLAMSHFRFQQTSNGTPIVGAEYILHQRDKSLKGNGTIL